MPGAQRVAVEDGELVPLCDVADDLGEERRITFGGDLASIDRLFGGGFVEGSLTLFVGPPGIGKSSFTLQMLQRLAEQKHRVIFATGEESITQVARRAKRLGTLSPRLQVVRETDLDELLEHVRTVRPALVAIDSLQTLNVDDGFAIGSAAAVGLALRAIGDFAREESKTSFLLIGHVTKDGGISGSRSGTEHACDTALFFDGRIDDHERTLSIPAKNRFGMAGPGAIAKFEMTERGLIPVDSGAPEKPQACAS